MPKKKPVKKGDTRYNQYHREYMVSQREDARDIGELPPCENPERKKACEHDLVLFCNTYFPEHFFREWTASQIEIARNIEKVINVGGFQAIAHKRRGAKTTICRGGLLWAVLYGKHMYSFFAGSEGGAATDAKTFIEMELLENNLLLEDFPEVCYPIRCTEGIKQRKVKYHGDACNISTSGDKIVLPTMRVYDKDGNLVKTKEGKPMHYPASGALIRFISVASTGVRGRQYRLSDRDITRPSLALIDDPQSDASARSDTEIGKLADFVENVIKPASGYKKGGKIEPMRILMTVTCIKPNDFAVRYTNRREKPEFNGILFRRFPKMPNPIPHLWYQYKDLWSEEGGSRAKPCMERKATQFYLANREAMDRGFEVDDENDYEDFQVSAIQYGMDIWCENEPSFWCEHQNDPEMALASVTQGISPAYIVREKTKRLGRGTASSRRWIPEGTQFLAGFIDVGLHYLNYEVTAFGKGYSFAHVVDFGYFPDQRGWHEIRKSSFNVDMQKFYQSGSAEEKISYGVRDCLTHIFGQEYFDHNGEPFDVHAPIDYTFGRNAQKGRFLAMVGVDASDGHQTESVFSGIAQFNAESREDFPVMNRAIPCIGDKTRTRSMRYFDLKPGEWQRGRDKFGYGEGDWIEFPHTFRWLTNKYTGQVESCMLWESNPFRTMRNIAWLAGAEANGTQTIFGDVDEVILPYARQQCSMVATLRKLPGMEYQEWVELKPQRFDKEFFDTNAGSWMIASYVGLNPEFGVTIEGQEAVSFKGGNWLDKVKEKNESKMSQVRGRTRR